MNMIRNINQYEMLKRIRKISILVLTSFAVLCTYLMVPNLNLPVTSIIVEPEYFSQISNASWIPMAAAICTGIFLPLVGVLYCKNTLTEDLSCGMLPLIRTSPTASSSFLFGRFLANLEVLLGVLIIVMIGSYVMICALFSPDSITIHAFFTPFFVVIPGIIFAAAMAVLLDCISIRWKKGNSLGLVLFLAFYICILTISAMNAAGFDVRTGILDFTGLEWLIASISGITAPITGRDTVDITILAGGDAIQASASFPALVFQGVSFSGPFLLQKIILCLISILLVFLASALLPKYIPETSGDFKRNKNRREKTNKGISSLKKEKHIHFAEKDNHTESGSTYANQKFSIPGLLRLQIILYFRGLSAIWWIILAALICISAFAPLKTAENMVVPLMFGWSFVLLSRIGCLEHTNDMVSQTLCLPGAYVRQLIYGLLCGIVFSIIISFPIIIRCAFAGEFSGISAMLAFALFIPSLSLLLGELSRSPRLSEVIILILCFLMLNEPSIIIGISPEYVSAARTSGMLILSAAAIILAAFKRYVAAGKRLNKCALFFCFCILFLFTGCNIDEKEPSVLVDETIDADITDIDIQLKNGSVTLMQSDSDQFRLVQQSGTELASRYQVTWKIENGTLIITDNNTKLVGINYASSIILYCPDYLYETLTINDAGTNDISIQNLQANMFQTDTTFGDVSVVGNFKDMDIQSSGGDISVTVNKTDSNLSLNTNGGDITLNGMFSTVSAISKRGDILLSSSIMPDQIAIETFNGDITLILPEDGGFTLICNKDDFDSEFSLSQEDDAYIYQNGNCPISIPDFGSLELQIYND